MKSNSQRVFQKVYFSNNGLFCYLRFAEICIGNLNFSTIALEPFYTQKIIFIWNKKGAQSNFQGIQNFFLPHCAFRSIFYACVVKGDFFSTSIPCASLVGTQWIFICFFALNFSYFFPEIGRHLFLLFYCYVTSAQRFILQRSRTRLVKIWQLLFQCFLFDFCR